MNRVVFIFRKTTSWVSLVILNITLVTIFEFFAHYFLHYPRDNFQFLLKKYRRIRSKSESHLSIFPYNANLVIGRLDRLGHFVFYPEAICYFYVENTDEYARQVNCTRKFFHTMPKKPTGHFAHTLVKMYDFIKDNTEQYARIY